MCCLDNQLQQANEKESLQMKYMKSVIYLLAVSMFVATSPAFAGHDHGGGQNSGGQPSSPSPTDQQATKTSEQLLKNCTQHVDTIQRHIDRLQARITEKRAVSSVNNELETLEQKLIEAKEIVRSLQIY